MRSILVVDDEVFVTRVTKLALERAGYYVEVAADGEEAFRSLWKHPFDVVITDLIMPRMGGRELCLAIHEHCPDQELLIFVATSSSEEEHRDWARDLPRTEFLEKPLSLRRLIARLEEHFEKTPDDAEPQR